MYVGFYMLTKILFYKTLYKRGDLRPSTAAIHLSNNVPIIESYIVFAKAGIYISLVHLETSDCRCLGKFGTQMSLYQSISTTQHY